MSSLAWSHSARRTPGGKRRVLLRPRNSSARPNNRRLPLPDQLDIEQPPARARRTNKNAADQQSEIRAEHFRQARIEPAQRTHEQERPELLLRFRRFGCSML